MSYLKALILFAKKGGGVPQILFSSNSKSDRVLQSRLSSIRDQSKLQPGIYYQ